LAAAMMLAGAGFAQQTSTPAATTPAAPAATTPKAATAASASVKKTATAKVAESAPLKTKTEKFSYALGMNIGTNLEGTLKKQSVVVDWNLVAQGLKEATAGGKTRLTEDEAKAVLSDMQKEVQEQQAAKAKEAGEKNKKDGEEFLAANKVLTAGTGPKPTAADSVVCNYKGTLIDGKEFDSSFKRGQPATFGVGQVIKGWTEALQLMPVGSKWQLFIPSNLGYGERGAGGDIGPNSTLVFEVELLSIVDKNADKGKDEKKDKPEEKKQ
jgi:FKBP-type peptidyl-prolyl cis-trans isomerase